MTVNDVVAFRVKKLMREQGMSQYKLSKESGVPLGALDRILTGKNKTVTLTTIYKLAKAFNMTTTQFLDDELFSMDKVEFE